MRVRRECLGNEGVFVAIDRIVGVRKARDNVEDSIRRLEWESSLYEMEKKV